MSGSFFDQCKTFYRSMPEALSSSAKHVLGVIFFHADQDGVTYVGTDTIAEIARMKRSACFRAIQDLEKEGVLLDDGWEIHGPFSRTRRRRICLDGADRSRRAKREGQRIIAVEKQSKSVPKKTGSPIPGTSVIPSDENGSSHPVDLGSPISGISVVPSVGLGSSHPWDSHIKMNLPGEPKRRTTQENHPGGTEQENRILSEKIRTMDVVGEAIGENSKPAQDSLLSPAEDEALASLRGPTKATTRKATRRPASDVEGFDEWYDLYARKEARGAAEKAYRKAVKGGVPPAVLLACLRRHLPAMQRKIAAGERQYVPYPASWLNAERWADGLSNEQKRALCAPGSDVERLLDEALGAGVGESEAPRRQASAQSYDFEGEAEEARPEGAREPIPREAGDSYVPGMMQMVREALDHDTTTYPTEAMTWAMVRLLREGVPGAFIVGEDGKPETGKLDWVRRAGPSQFPTVASVETMLRRSWAKATRERQVEREPVAGGAKPSRQPAPSNDGFWDEERDGPLPDRQSQPSINAASQEVAPAGLQPGDREVVDGRYVDVVTEAAYAAIGHKSRQFPDLHRHVRDWMMAGLDPEEITGPLAWLNRKGISARDTEQNLGRVVLKKLADLTPQERAARQRPVEIETAADRRRGEKRERLMSLFCAPSGDVQGRPGSDYAAEFERLDPSDDLFRQMLAGLKNHAASELWQDRRNIPTLATWLCERQWERRLELPEWKRPEVIAARKAALSGRAVVTLKPRSARENPFDDSPQSPPQPAVPTPPPGPKPYEISQQVREMLGANAERVGLGDEVEAMLVVAQWRGQHISPEAIYAGARALVSRPPESWTPAALDGLVRQGSGVTLH